MTIIGATHNPTMAGILKKLRNVSSFYFEVALRADSGDYAKRNRHHDDLIACLRRRDAVGAEAVRASHFPSSEALRRRLEKVSSESQVQFSPRTAVQPSTSRVIAVAATKPVQLARSSAGRS
jgi:DNA-binding GntR family transcriptional regulator